MAGGGVVIAIVKITAFTRAGNPEKTGPQLADNGKKPAAEEPDVKNDPPSQDGKGSTNAVLSDDENEQIRIKIREETKQILKRKITPGGSDEPNWQPIATANDGNSGNGGIVGNGNVGNGNAGNQQALGLNQRKINDAIDKGVAYLKSSQMPNGTWNNSHAVGHAAIGGLTLLECKVPADDPAVQRAATFCPLQRRQPQLHL